MVTEIIMSTDDQFTTSRMLTKVTVMTLEDAVTAEVMTSSDIGPTPVDDVDGKHQMVTTTQELTRRRNKTSDNRILGKF